MSSAVRAPRRILFLLTEVFAKGGIQRFNQTLLSACGGLDVECEVLSLHDCSAARAAGQPAADIALPFAVRGFSGSRPRFALAAMRAILQRRFDWILIGHVNFLRLGAVAMLARPFARDPGVLIAHGIEVWRGLHGGRARALARMQKVLCVSRYTKQRIMEQAPAMPPERLAVFPNALAQSWESASTSDRVRRDLPPRFILSVTRLEKGDRYKGIVTVIEALSMLADDTIHYFVVGKGNDLAFLRTVAGRCGMSRRVHFLSGLDDDDLVGLYERCLAFVLPSGKEGFGIVFLEAMYFGAPVIAAAEKGAVDVVQDGETGLLVRFGDSIAVRNAIEKIAADGDLRRRLKESARSTVTVGGDFTFEKFRARFARELGLREASAT